MDKVIAGITAIIVVGFIGYVAMSQQNQPAPQNSPATSPGLTQLNETTQLNEASTATPTASAAATEKENTKMVATITTTHGNIVVELFAKDAPKTVENFKQLAEKDYYNGVTFHRVIKEFMIQGGDPTGTGAGGESAYGKPFEDEFNQHKIVAGTLAMANRGPNTNGSQFFIVTERAQPHLDGRHTAFGQVVDGMDVVQKIAAVPVDAMDKPLEDVKITGITIEEQQ